MGFTDHIVIITVSVMSLNVNTLRAHSNSLYTGVFRRDSTLDGKTCSARNKLFIKTGVKVQTCMSTCQELPSCQMAVFQTFSNSCIICKKEFTGEDYSDMGDLENSTVWNRINVPKTNHIDCKRIQLADPGMESGVYRIYPVGGTDFLHVVCNMTSGVGGYTVFQQRIMGHLRFNRSFTDYENWFGSAFKDYWIGLANIHRMTHQTSSDVLLVFVDKDNIERYQKLDGFSVGEAPGYTVNVERMLGRNDRGVLETSVEESFYDSRGQNFSTYDLDQDNDTSANCALDRGGGWWFNQCGPLNPNGKYVTPGTDAGWLGMVNFPFRGLESLKATRLMFRP